MTTIVVSTFVLELLERDAALSAESAAIVAKPVGTWTREEDDRLAVIIREQHAVGAMMIGAIGAAVTGARRQAVE